MVWNIVSFGDVVTLQTVFNAVGAISANSTYKAAAAAVALLVFVIAMLSSVSDGKQELPIPRLLAAFFIYVAGFNTLGTVGIENRYDGTTTTIDNIPIAIAVPASLISNIGLVLAELTETAFGSTNPQERVTERGYLSPLKALAAYRDIAYKSCPAGDGNSVLSGYRFCPSFHNYMRDCAMVKAKRDGLTRTMKEGDFFTNIQFNSSSFATFLVRSSGVIEEQSCRDAYSKIITMINSGDFGTMYAHFNERMGVRTGEDVESVTSDVLASIGADAAMNRNLMKTMMASKLAEEGELSFYYKNNASDYAENLQSSVEQRNYGWIIQGEMWVQIVNKFIAIMECLLYALTPFIGLMALCGSVGSKTLLLFLQMLAVIQLIPMLLVVAQSVVMGQMARAVTEIGLQYETGSIEWIQAIFEQAKDLLGLGGMIAATIVPAMAMSLVTGSGMAMMGAMKGAAATAKDTDATPEISKQGGAIEDWGSLNSGTRDAYGNTMTQSAESRVGNISRNLANSSSVSDAQTRMQTTQANYQQAVENALTNSNGNAFSTNEILKAGQSINSGSSTMQNFAEKHLTSIADSYGLQGQEKNDFIQAMSAGLQLVGTGGKTAEQFAESLSSNVAKAYQDATSGEKGIALQAKFDEAKNAAYENGESVTTNNSEMDSRAERVSQARQEVEASTNQYQNAVSVTDTASIMNDDVRMGLAMIGQDENVQRSLDKQINENRDNPEWLRRFSQNYQEMDGGVNGTDLDSDSAKLAAFMVTNNELGNMEDNQAVLSQYHGQQPSSPEEIRTNGVNPNISEGLPNNPKYGELDRQPIVAPTQGVVPNSLNVDENDPLSENRATLMGNFTKNANDVEKFGDNFFNSDQFKQYQDKVDDMKQRLGVDDDTNIVPLEHTQENIKDSIASMLSDGVFDDISQKVGHVANPISEQVDNAKEAVSNAYKTMRAAFYESPIGQAEKEATEMISEKFNALNEYLDSNEALDNPQQLSETVSGFIDDVSGEIANLFTYESESNTPIESKEPEQTGDRNNTSISQSNDSETISPLVNDNENQSEESTIGESGSPIVNNNLNSDNEPLSQGNDGAGEYSTNYPHYEKIVNDRQEEIEKEERRDENSRNELERLQSIDDNYNPVGVDDIPR